MGDLKKAPELEEYQLGHDDENPEIGASDNSFNSSGEPRGESDLDCDPSRDHSIELYYILTSQIDYFLSPLYIVYPVG